MDVTNYQNWLSQQWNSTALSEIREGRRKKRQLYSLDAMKLTLEGYALRQTWPPEVTAEDMLGTVIEPYLPVATSEIGIFFRDYPIPKIGDRQALVDRFNLCKVPQNITGLEIESFFKHGKPYGTFQKGFAAAHSIAAHLQLTEMKEEQFVRSSVVGDLVKLQAPFQGATGRPFAGQLSKRSCHSWGMYAFAGRLFADEVATLDLKFVVGFGARSVWASAINSLQAALEPWNVHVPTDGRGKALTWTRPDSWKTGRHFILLPHPQAYANALGIAVESICGPSPLR